MAYAILRTAKLKTAREIMGSGEHTFRERTTPNADKLRTHLNYGTGARNATDLLKNINDRIETCCTRKPRTDSPRCIEFLIAYSPEAKLDYKEYFKDSVEWLKKEFGADNIIATDVQLDEKTPHMVAYITPITDRGSLSSREWLGGREKLTAMQTRFAAEVGKKHGLIRGLENSVDKHMTNQEFRAIRDKKFNELLMKHPPTPPPPPVSKKADGLKILGKVVHYSAEEYDALHNRYVEMHKANTALVKQAEALRLEATDSHAKSVAANTLVALAQKNGELLKAKDIFKKEAVMNNRTYLEVMKQVKAFGLDTIEVGIRNEETGKMRRYEVSGDAIEKHISYWKHTNAGGNHLYIKPPTKQVHPYILLDDLTADKIARLKAKIGKIAMVVETSPGNFQAWVRLPEPLDVQQRTVIAKMLAAEFGADMASADGAHFGRMAGMTNRKLKYRDERGYHPFSVIKGTDDGKASLDVKEYLKRHERQEIDEVQKIITSRPPQGADKVPDFYSSAQDISRADMQSAIWFAAALKPFQFIFDWLKANSPNIEKRKIGHIDDYCRRTAQRAVEYVSKFEQKAPAPTPTPTPEDIEPKNPFFG